MLTLNASNLNFSKPEVESLSDFVGIFVMVYSGVFSFALFGFAAYQIKLALMNITSNENIREKWNATLERQE